VREALSIGTLLAAALLWTGLARQVSGSPYAEGQLVVIANSGVPLDSMDFTELRGFFMGDRLFWNSALPAVLVAPPRGTPERDYLLKRVCQMNEMQYNRYWIARVFQVQATSPPRSADTREKSIDFVSRTPGAISIALVSSAPEGTKSIKVRGMPPFEPDD